MASKDMKKTKAESLTPIFLQYKNGFIYSLAFFIIYGYITNSQYNQVPAGLIAQLEEHCIGMTELMGSNPIQAWIFFTLKFYNFFKSCVYNCDDQSCHHIFLPSSNMWPFIYLLDLILMHPKPHIHVKNLMSTRLRMYKVSLFTRSKAQRERSFIVGNLDVISLFARCWENSHSSLPVARWQK